MTYRPRIVLAAPKSGSGKTLLTCSMIRALLNRGMKVSAFKTGPDYIDPMFHRQVLGVPSSNLDLFFTDEDTTREIFNRNAVGDISVLEGVMGLFDGLGGLSEEGSTYHLARTLNAPVILVIDARGMSRSVLAEIAGFLSMDHAHLIKGVLLNRFSPMLYPQLKKLVWDTLHIPLVGCFPNDPGTKLESRYLGLKLPGEIENIHQTLDHAAKLMEESVDLDAIIKIAREAPDMCRVSVQNVADKAHDEAPACGNCDDFKTNTPVIGQACKECDAKPVRIGVARDEAFCFYYEENLQVLRECGAQIVAFSPLHDAHLPEDIDGLLMGGGYPEQYAKMLSENTAMRREIAQAIESGMPSLAECGGFMYLHESIQTQEGDTFPMVGAVRGGCRYMGKLVRFGYITLTEKEPCFMESGDSIRAHEFHYFDSDDSGSGCTATKPTGKRSWPCEIVSERSFWGYPHLYYRSNPAFVKRFIGQVKMYREERTRQ